MSFWVCIPARMGSTRLPGKPLQDINGKPIIEHVYLRARESGAARIVVATDDSRIEQACRDFDAEVCMTDPAHASGTDRVAEAMRMLGAEDDRLVINLQGDEPLMPGNIIDALAEMMIGSKDKPGIGTVASPIASAEEFDDPNVVKVVMDVNGNALYFSRARVPYPRDSAQQHSIAWRHLGIYAFRGKALQDFVALPVAGIEKTESLEQLRALANGMSIRVCCVDTAPPRGIDTESDLEAARRHLAG